eukprot:1182545-Prorocentrum_minimum.AAC.3
MTSSGSCRLWHSPVQGTVQSRVQFSPGYSSVQGCASVNRSYNAAETSYSYAVFPCTVAPYCILYTVYWGVECTLRGGECTLAVFGTGGPSTVTALHCTVTALALCTVLLLSLHGTITALATHLAQQDPALFVRTLPLVDVRAPPLVILLLHGPMRLREDVVVELRKHLRQAACV